VRIGSRVAVARSSPGGVAVRYVLPVLWMTSRLAAVGRLSVRALSLATYSARRWVARSDVYECLVLAVQHVQPSIIIVV